MRAPTYGLVVFTQFAMLYSLYNVTHAEAWKPSDCISSSTVLLSQLCRNLSVGLYGKVEEALRIDGLASVRVKESGFVELVLNLCCFGLCFPGIPGRVPTRVLPRVRRLPGASFFR